MTKVSPLYNKRQPRRMASLLAGLTKDQLEALAEIEEEAMRETGGWICHPNGPLKGEK